MCLFCWPKLPGSGGEVREKSPLFWQYFANSLSSIVDNYAILYKGGRSQASKTQVLFSESYFTPKATIHTLLLVGLPWIYEEATHIYIYYIYWSIRRFYDHTANLCLLPPFASEKNISKTRLGDVPLVVHPLAT